MTPDPVAVPDGWQVVRLGDVATLQRGMDLPEDKRIFGRVPVFGSNGVHGFHNASPVQGPGVITGRSGSMGHVYYSESSYWPLNTTLFVKDFHGNDERFVFHLLSNFRLERFAASTGVPSLNRNFVHPLPALLPPLAEQRAIAAVLDAIDEAIGRTGEVIAAAERLRDALLHELLTRGLPGRHSEWADVPGLGTVPACWEVVRLGDVCERITKGTTPTTLGHEYTQSGVRFLRVENIGHGLVEGGQLRFISEETHIALSRSVLREHDLLLSIAGALGRSALVTKDVLPANVNQALAIIRLGDDPRIEPEFMSLALRARGVQRQVDDMRSELAQANINLEQVGSLRVPHPPPTSSGPSPPPSMASMARSIGRARSGRGYTRCRRRRGMRC